MNDPLRKAVERAAEVLPAQGPIPVFIHHNTLHAFEDLPFEEAVVAAGEIFGCEPFMPEEFYRAELRAGRVRGRDLEAVVREDLGADASGEETGLGERAALRLAWLEHGVPEGSGEPLSWLLSETDALEKFRSDLPPGIRARLLARGVGPGEERRAVRDLWEACLAAVPDARPAGGARKGPVRHRDLILASTGEDPDALANPFLIRLCAAYLDEGIAAWPMPHRERGFYECATRLYSRGFAPPERWLARLRRLLTEERAAGRDAAECLEHSLARLGVRPPAWADYLTATALALRGWAGMMRYVERRADRIPLQPAPATLLDYLAVRLLVDRAAAEEVSSGHLGPHADLAAIGPESGRMLTAPRPASAAERAWPLFHLAQIAGRSGPAIAGLGAGRIDALFEEMARFDGPVRRRLLHLAYERKLRHELYDAVTEPRTGGAETRPAFQAVFCIDEREESMRRHLEEVFPACETFGAAGFFGVAVYHRTEEEARGRALCPGNVKPEKEVLEVRTGTRKAAAARDAVRRAIGRLDLGMAVGGRGLLRGTIGTATLGALAAFPLLFRVLYPRLAASLRHGGQRILSAHAGSVLLVERSAAAPGGFTPEEMSLVVRRQLEEAGIARPAEIVLVVGHRSTSLNNPHESAHDCGACGGSGGGVNARAFALMANHPEVRRTLAAQAGLDLEGSWFIGAEHDTASDSIEYFDLDGVPGDRVPSLRAAMDALDEARRRNAHERCRRFRAAPLGISKEKALAHVQTRSEDLAQTRPEYGHATNAFCIVGRRSRTRGLFLDRRAFLVSYDPACDDAGSSVLARILAAVVPVVSGISLEYYFSFVDSDGYGCGTKLPHNVAGLVGVMDGHASDLRTGLPHQMVEIHEPVRLTLLVEAPRDALIRIVRSNTAIERLVTNRWIVAAALDPLSGAIHEIRGSTLAEHAREGSAPECAGSSADWYGGRREFLEFARLGAVPAVRRS